MFRRCGQISIIAWIEQVLASDQNRFWTFKKTENAKLEHFGSVVQTHVKLIAYLWRHHSIICIIFENFQGILIFWSGYPYFREDLSRIQISENFFITIFWKRFKKIENLVRVSLYSGRGILIFGRLIVHLKICVFVKSFKMLVFQLRQIRLNLTKFRDTFDWSNFQFGSDTVTTVSVGITVLTINQTFMFKVRVFSRLKPATQNIECDVICDTFSTIA